MEKLILALLLLLPAPRGADGAAHRAWAFRVAPAISAAAHGDRQIAAYLVTIGFSESRMARRVQAGHCKSYECDRGRAASMWQLHTVVAGGDLALVTGTDQQHLYYAADRAANVIRAARARCGPQPARVIAGYAAGTCKWNRRAAAGRARLYQRLLARLRPVDR